MKKFLIYVIVIVTGLFLGFTVYYLSLNNEEIKLTISNENYLYYNSGEGFALPISWTKASSQTTLNVEVSNEEVLTYDADEKWFDCHNGGLASVTITPSNTRFGPFVFEVYVGDGSLNFGYAIRSLDEFSNIGNISEDPRFSLDKSYILTTDIYLTENWSPLGAFTGKFNGNGHVIYNLSVTSGTKTGLFETVEANGIVENIKFNNAKIEGSFENAGIVAGVNKGTIGKIQIVSATIKNTNTASNTGAIAGQNIMDTTSAVVNMCSVNADIDAVGNVGGFVGLNKSSIIANSRAVVNLTAGDAAKLGGIAGVVNSTYTADKKYYSSLIKNTYVVINSLNKAETSVVGAVVGSNQEETYAQQVLYNSYVGSIYSLAEGLEVQSVGEGSEIISAQSAQNLILTAKATLVNESTYAGYNFDTVWYIDGSMANIDFTSMYENFRVLSVGAQISSEEVSLEDMLNTLRLNPSVDIDYVVSQDTELDLGGIAWQTIAPTAIKPLTASISVAEGVTCTIKNFKLQGEQSSHVANSSFFGYISGNTTISGINFEEVSYEYATSADGYIAESGAIVATGILNGAVLQDINVNNITSFSSRNLMTGLICGYNQGSIINCHVNNSFVKEIKIASYTNSSAVNYGSIVGTNYGLVDNCSVDNIKLTIDVAVASNGKFNIGGIVGNTTGNVSNSATKGFEFETTNTGLMYVGGVIGYASATSNATISKCYSLANISIDTSSEGSYIGGVVSYLGNNVTLKNSFHDDGSLTARRVGGIVAYNYGKVLACYVGKVNIKAYQGAGLVMYIYGNMSNCYTLAHLNGYSTGKNAAVSGLCHDTYSGSSLTNCFSDATFSGSATRYAETTCYFRMAQPTKFFAEYIGQQNVDGGKIEKNIVLVNNGANIQYTSGMFNKKDGWIDCSKEDCLGKNGYSVFKNNGFDGTIWNFDGENAYPTLKNMPQKPVVSE